MRTFISINPGPEIRNKFIEIQYSLKQQISKKDLDSIKWEPPDKLHLTLFFIGEVNEEKTDAIHAALSEVEQEMKGRQFELAAGSINVFPDLRYPRVIIVELENKDNSVFDLSGKISSGLSKTGFTTDKKFVPHITLGRVRRNRKINLSNIDKSINSKINFLVKDFFLMKSQLKSTGSEYSVLKKYLL